MSPPWAGSLEPLYPMSHDWMMFWSFVNVGSANVEQSEAVQESLESLGNKQP